MKRLSLLQDNVKPSLHTRVWHRIQERIRHPRWRHRAAAILAALRPRSHATEAAEAANVVLTRDGVYQMPGFVASDEIAAIAAELKTLLCFDPWKPASGYFDADQIPPGTHVAHIQHAPMLARLHDLALDPNVIAIVGRYLGCRPYLDSVQAWWSVSGNELAEEAENFHRDNDSIRFLKLFLYATDVDVTNGPHVFVRGSHVLPVLTERRRLTDAEVTQAFGADTVQFMMGRAGDAFIEDTYGIHKGQLPMAGRRLLIQFRYSVTETVFRAPSIFSVAQGYNPQLATSLLHGS